MSTAILSEEAAESEPARKTSKLDLWIIWWSMPIFYNVFAIALFGLAKNQPPPPAYWNAQEILAWVNSHPSGVMIGNWLWLMCIGFPSWHIGLIVVLLKRMSVSPAFAYAYLGVMAAATLPGGMFFSYGYCLLALRPDRDPAVYQFIYDFANLTFMGSMGVFFIGSAILAVAIILDKNKILPKWFGYACIWNLTTEFTVAPMWIFRHGPLAWDGEVSFYWNMVIYGTWQIMYIVVFYHAIRKLPPKQITQTIAPGSVGALG